MPSGLVVLGIFAILILFGVLDKVLLKMRTNSTTALIIISLVAAGVIIPPINIGNSFSMSIGGFIIPFALCVYLFARSGANEVLRALLTSLIVMFATTFVGLLFPIAAPSLIISPLVLTGLLAGTVSYLIGRTRKCAFVSAILGFYLAQVLSFVIDISMGYPSFLALGAGDAFSAIVFGGILALGITEFAGELEKTRPSPLKYSFEADAEHGFPDDFAETEPERRDYLLDTYKKDDKAKYIKLPKKVGKDNIEKIEKALSKNQTIKTEAEKTLNVKSEREENADNMPDGYFENNVEVNNHYVNSYNSHSEFAESPFENFYDYDLDILKYDKDRYHDNKKNAE